MNKPVFSVVIPLYNKGPHIGRTVRSVLAQGFDDFELIIVDDASTDNSVQEVEGIPDARIRLLHRSVPGPGGYAARNLGIRSSSADWVALLDADDTWEPDYLESMRRLQEQFPQASILCSGWRIQEADGSSRTNQYLRRFEGRGRHLIDLERFLDCATRGCNPMCSSAVTLRRDLLLEIGGFPEGRCRRGGDIDTWLRAMLQGGVAAWYPEACAVYHHEAANRVSKYTPYDLNGACTPQTVRKRLEAERDPAVRRALMRFSNRYQLSGIRQRAKDGTLTPDDVRTLYAAAEPLRVLPYALAALLPGWVQRRAARLYGRIG